MLTRAAVESITDDTAVLARDGQELLLRVLAPAGAILRTYDTASPRSPHDHPNRGTRMIGFEVSLRAGATERIVVQLAPGAATATAPPIVPLAKW